MLRLRVFWPTQACTVPTVLGEESSFGTQAGVDAHHARVAVGDSLAIRVFLEKGLHILNIRCS